MKRVSLFLLILTVVARASHAETVVSTFEDLGLPASSFNNNAGPSGQFVSGGSSFNNSYDPSFGAWFGWSISSMTDTTTPGYTNQYSAITGIGAGGSQTYAVAYTFGDNTNPLAPAQSYVDLPAGLNPVSTEITNTTYVYFSMLNGDQFSKQFGAGDFLLLTVTGWTGLDGTGSTVGNGVTMYLANFLNGNSSIVNTWETLNLTSLAGARSLQFGLQSSDNGQFGMNTPAYFAMDDLVLQGNASVPEPSTGVLLVLAIICVPLFMRVRAFRFFI